MVRLRFETDLGSSLKASRDLDAAIGKVGDSLGKAAGGAKALELAAKRITDANLSPQEKYNQKIDRLGQLVKSGALQFGEAEKAATRFRAQLERTTRSQEKLFGPGMLQNIGGYVAGVAGISAGLAALSAQFVQTAADVQAAADRMKSSLGTAGELAQVGLGPSAPIIKSIRQRGIQTDKGLAEQLAFQLQSSDIVGRDAEDILSLAAKGLISSQNILPVATGAKKFQRAFGSQSIESVMDMAAQASKGTSADLSRTLMASLEFAPGAKALGIGQLDALAALVTVEQQTKNIEQAGTAMKSFLSTAQQRGIKGASMEALVGDIQGRMAKGKSAFDVLGNAEAVGAFQKISGGMGTFREQLGLIGGADVANVAMVAADTLAADPNFQAALVARRSEGSRMVADEELYGRARNLTVAVREQITERSRRRGPGWAGTWMYHAGEALRGVANRAEDFFGGEDQFLRGLTRGEISRLTPDLQSEVNRYQSETLEEQRKQTAVLERIEGQERTRPPRPAGRQEN